jgi:hypothetical protein
MKYFYLPFILYITSACTPVEKQVFEEGSNEISVYEDNDNDGYYSYSNSNISDTGTSYSDDPNFDCDDNNPNIHAGASEVCDGVDNDCDEEVDENVLTTYFSDFDGDGFGLTEDFIEACNPPENFVPISNDCDDNNPLIYPASEEFCDGFDNNCNDLIDENVGIPLFEDEDHDGFGNPDTMFLGCVLDGESLPEGIVDNDSDCEDQNDEIHPNAQDICDDLDNNCNNLVDEDLMNTYYTDWDGDGFGNNTPIESCAPEENYVQQNGDCDDSDFMIKPFVSEICDLIDNNCDGQIDENVLNTYFSDSDEDGFGDPNNTILACSPTITHIEDNSDCNDTDPTQNPNGIEVCNGEDDNCDEEIDNESIDAITWFLDIDGDGFGSIFVTQDSCEQPPAPPGYSFVLDQSDCDDTRDSIYPQAIEYCNGFDDDCDGQTDVNAVDALIWYANFDNDDYGDPLQTQIQCTEPFGYIDIPDDCDDSNPNIYPFADESCNNEDDDCNGLIDDNAIDSIPFFPDIDEDGFGDPNAPVLGCEAPPNYLDNDLDCDDTNLSIYPFAQEFCDGLDQDCDGNNFYELDLDNNGLLACQESMWMRNSSSSATGPFGSFSQAASYLTNQNITIADLYHGDFTITPELLENIGLYVHHGNNMNGALGAYTNAEASALEQWVYHGGRMLFMGYHSTEDACESSNSIPYQFGVSCDALYYSWSGDSSTFVEHPITDGLTTIGGLGGENWVVTAPAQVLASVDGYEFVVVVEYGKGKVVLIADEWPYYNPRGGKSIDYADNALLVENTWNWLLE